RLAGAAPRHRAQGRAAGEGRPLEGGGRPRDAAGDHHASLRRGDQLREVGEGRLRGRDRRASRPSRTRRSAEPAPHPPLARVRPRCAARTRPRPTRTDVREEQGAGADLPYAAGTGGAVEPLDRLVGAASRAIAGLVPSCRSVGNQAAGAVLDAAQGVCLTQPCERYGEKPAIDRGLFRFYADRIETGYLATALSAVMSVNPSLIACATSIRSNGSSCKCGSERTAIACSPAIGSSSYPFSTRRRRRREASTRKSLRPKPCLITISHKLATLKKSWLSGLAISVRSFGERRSGVPAAHNKTCVSSSSFKKCD